jgi:hypothetical protein
MMRKRKMRRWWIGAACLGLGAAVSVGAPARADQPTTAPSLDDLLNLPQPGAGGKTPEPAPGKTSSVKPDAEVTRRMSGQQAAEAFAKAVQDMYDVSERLAKQQDPGDDTQRMQGDILNKLEQVIAAAQQQQQSKGKSSDDKDQQDSREADSGSQDNSSQSDGDQGEPGEPGSGSKGGKSKPGKSAKGGSTPGTATASASGGTAPDSAILKDSRESWGKLPPRLRDQLLEGLSENVSPVYKDMTESYYRRLAEESGK